MTTPAIIQPELKDISLLGGVNEAYRKEALDWTKYFTKLENLVIDDYGSLSKRPGRQIIGLRNGTDVSDDEGNGFLGNGTMRAYKTPLGSAMSVLSGDGLSPPHIHNLYQYNEAKDSITNVGRMPDYAVTSFSIPPSQHNSSAAWAAVGSTKVECSQVVAVGDYYVAAVSNPDGYAFMHVIDAKSGGVVRTERFGNANNTHVYLCAVGTDVHIYVSGSTGTATFYRYQTVGLTISGSTNLSVASGLVVAATSLPDGSGSVAVQITGTSARIQKFNTSGASAGTATLATSYPFDIYADGSSVLHLACTDTGTGVLRVARYNSSLVHQGTVSDAGLAPVGYSCVRIVTNTAGTEGRLLCWRTNTLGTYSIPSCDVWLYETASVPSTWGGTITGWTEASLPFYNNITESYYVALTKRVAGMVGTGGGSSTATAETTGRTVVADITTSLTAHISTYVRFRPAACLGGYTDLTNLANVTSGGGGAMTTGSGTYYGSAPRPMTNDAGKTWFIPTTFQNTATSIGHQVNVLKLFSAKELGCAGSELSGGVVYHCTGAFPSELGFLDRPTIIASQGAAGGPAAGSRNYVAVYEFIGTDGQVHYSQTSPVCTWTNTGGNQVTLNVSLPQVMGREWYDSVRCNIYRTVTNGTTYYYLASITTGTTITLPAVSFTAVNDTTSDATIAAQPIMYRQAGTSGTALDRYAPLASQAICQHKDRIIVSNGSNVYYSSYKVDGEAPWFNPAFSFYVPGGSGDITGLSSMDGQLFIFKRDGIWVVDGDGPPENGGTGTEFTPPRRLRTEFGCIDQRTVVVTPIGIMYRSGRGIEVLEPNGQVTWIGEPVKDTVDSNPYPGGPCVDRANGRVMFPMGDTEGQYPGLLMFDGVQTANGITAVYDISARAWTTANYQGSNPGEAGAYVQDYLYSRHNGQDVLMSLGAACLAYHNPESYLDATANIYAPFILETGWIKWDSIQDRVRVSDLLVLCKKVTNHNLTVSVAYDYSDTYSYSKTWTPADINGLSLEQLELQIPKQVNQAVRFKITDSEPADTATYPVTTGKGPDIIGLTVKIGHKGGGAKLASGSKG